MKEMGVEILRPKENFFQLIAKKGFPSRFSRFCCEALKEYKVLDKTIIGVRKAESRARKERYNSLPSADILVQRKKRTMWSRFTLS